MFHIFASIQLIIMIPYHHTPHNTTPTTRVDSTTREVSLTAPPPTNAAGQILTTDGFTEEDFYSCIDVQLAKVEAFTLKQVTELRSDISSLETEVNDVRGEDVGEVERFREKADEVAKSFLVLEKYVNLNFMGE